MAARARFRCVIMAVKAALEHRRQELLAVGSCTLNIFSQTLDPANILTHDTSIEAVDEWSVNVSED
jgi:hypothetical protein